MIRYYEKSDISEIAKIIVDGWKNAYKGIIDEEFLRNLDYKERAESINKHYKKQNAIVYTEGGIVKGFCRFGQSRNENQECGEIYALYVKYDERKHGIGRQLVKRAVQLLNEVSYNEILIWCLKDNLEARKFYEKIGGILYKERELEIGNKFYKEVCYKYKNIL